jgi:hypothetical protein
MRLTTIFAALAVISGLVAAWYWYQSTKPTVPPVVEDNVMHAMKWFNGVKDTADQTARANKKAALWTAASVLLGAISTLSGALGSN